jgi:glycosyltransferase involved in cell wall biosynthesis
MGSEFAAQEARGYLGIEPSRSLVLPYGAGRRFGPQSAEAVRSAAERFGMRGRTVLFVGAHLQRRMLPELAEAVGRLARARPDLRLCLVGERPEAQDGAAVALPADRVQWLGWVDDEDLPAVYAAATVVAYPSTYEGFGLPVLEGLACGTPVVTSHAGSLGEIYPGRAWVVASDRPEAWESALATLLDSEKVREKWSTRALAWAATRRWETAAAMLRERLQQARESQ